MSRSMQRRRSNSVLSRQEARRRAAIGCAVESLEGRQLFSVVTVNTTADDTASDGQLSLREAIALIQNNGDANVALGRSLDGGEAAQVDTSTDAFGTNDTIIFDNSIAGGTITLGSTVNVSGTFVVDGGASGMTLSGGVSQATWRAFYVTSTGDLTLNKLTITNFSDRGSNGLFSPGGDGNGGAIYVDQGTLTITNSTLSNNSAAGGDGSLGPGGNARGGAIYVSHGTVTLTGSTLSNNSAAGGYGSLDNGGSAQGGALYVDQGTLTITDSTLSNNSTAGGTADDYGGFAQGGAVYGGSSTLTITNATLANNSAAGGIGGIGPGSGQGGAAYVADGNSTVSFSTVSSNTAAQGGRGLYVVSSGAAVVGIDNSILGQADNSVTDVEFSGTVSASGSNNLIRNTVVPGVTSLSSADPKLGPLQNNGGPTQTMRPATDSPAIDAADDSGGVVTTDQRGIARPAGAFDVGAAEFTRVAVTVSSTGDDDTRDSDLTLREAIGLANGTLSYAGLTAGEQAWVGATLGDAYDVTFDSSIAGGTINFGSAITVSGTVTVDGGMAGMALSGVGGHRAFYVTGTGDLALNNLTVANFGFMGTLGIGTPGGNGQGGAIYVDHGVLTITDSTLSNNWVQGGYGLGAVGGNAQGGAIYVDQGTLTVTNSTLSDNTAAGGYGDIGFSNGTGSGGAIFVTQGTLTLTDSALSDNAATGAGGPGIANDGRGGAVYTSLGTLTITGDTTLQGNTASGGNAAGGAIANNQGALTLNVTGGNVTQNTAGGTYGSGGAIYSFLGTASLTFTNSTLSDNSVTGDASGGFAYVEYGDLTLTDCTVNNNTASGSGGAIMFFAGTLSVTGGTASNNSATGSGTGDGRGGFIYNTNGAVTLTNVTVSGNSASSGSGTGGARGGAIYSQGFASSVTIVGGEYDQNSAVAGGGVADAGSGAGGAIYLNGGSLTVTGAVLSNNSAVGSDSSTGDGKSGAGGAIWGFGGSVTITDSAVYGNAATGGASSHAGSNGGDGLGGAVYGTAGSVTVVNSTLANNAAVGGDAGTGGVDGNGRGGAIYAEDTDATIHFSTLSGNTAAQGGRGLYFLSPSGTNLTISNSILGQADDSVTDLEVSGSGYSASGSNNLIRNTLETGIGNLSSADPKLGALQDNGGPTPTMRPAIDSPAINAADDSGGIVTTDQRGTARPGGAYDVGALELSVATLTVTGTDDDDTRDTVLTLREAFRLIDGRLDYNDLTVDEQALISGTLGDVYFIEFDQSLAGANFGISQDDSLPITAPPIFTPPTYGPTAFTVSKIVTITGLDDGNGNHINLAGDAFDLRLFLVTATGELTLKNLNIGDFVARGDDDGFAGENVLGGAILINGGTVTIEDSAFVNNRAIGGDGGIYGGHAAGGAIYNAYGNLTIRDSQFHENSAIGGDGEDDTGGNARGGAIYSQGGTVTLDMVNFDGNEALGGFGDFDGGGAYGGAIYTDGGTVTAEFLVVVGNRAAGGDSMDGDGGEAFGGGIYFADGTFDGTLVALVMNQANGGNGDGEGGDAHGGAVFVENGTFNVATFGMMDNAAHGGDGFFDQGGYAFGGALAIGGGAVTLTGGQITGNSAVGGDSEYDYGGDASGGAIDIMLGGELTLVSATVAQNAAHAGVGDGDGGSYGGAIHAYNSDLTINFSTISGNQAGGIRGILFEIDNGSHLIAIDNSILGEADDSDYDLVIGEFGGTLTRSGSHNLIRVTDATGIDIVSSADPRLAPLGTYGGMFFQTMALLPDSPALDAGGSAGSVTEDQRGADRVYNGTADIGAFESQGYTLTVNSGSTPQSAVVGNAFGSYLTVTLTENFHDAPIPGATVSFAVNTSGSASATFATTATTDIDGKASAIATANGSAGSYTVTASVGGSGDQAESADFSLTNTAIAPAITSANQSTFTVGSSGSFTITTTGTPTVTLSKSGTLPAGVTFVDNGDGTATLSGTPTAGGTFSLTITAHNDGSPDAVQTFTLTVNQAPDITSANQVTMTAGTAGTFTITTTGFPVAAITKAGTLPAGVTFHDNGDGTATLSGTPTGAAASYSLTITADSGGLGAVLQVFTLTVNPAPTSGVTGTAPTITSPAALSLIAGQAGTFTVTTTGSPIVTLHVTGTLPAGVTFVDNGNGTGTFSGTATAVGTYAVSVVADNGVGGPVTQALAITVNGARPIIVASGYAGGTISINNPDGTNRFTISNPFKKKNVGVRLASADLNGDGVADVIAAAGTSGQPQVIVYDGLTGDQLTSFMAFNKAFTGGVFVAAADVNHDGTPDIVVGQGIGGTSKVRVFSGKDSSLLADFNPFGSNAGGARVAAADVNGDGFAEVVVGQGFGGGQSMVKVIDGKALSKQGNAKVLSALSQAQLGFAGGAFVATGDVNGDGTPDILVSQSVGTKPYVTVVDGKKAAKNNLKSAVISKFRVTSDDGARITSNDVNGDGFGDIITSITLKGKSLVKIFSGADGSLLDTIESDGSGKGFVA